MKKLIGKKNEFFALSCASISKPIVEFSDRKTHHKFSGELRISFGLILCVPRNNKAGSGNMNRNLARLYVVTQQIVAVVLFMSHCTTAHPILVLEWEPVGDIAVVDRPQRVGMWIGILSRLF